jgi:N6-adenosine-specific RNA methylase IME4
MSGAERINQPPLFAGSDLAGWPFRDLPLWSFELLMIDPPWPFKLYSKKGKAKSPETHYETMSLEAIRALPVAQLASPNCLCWLWVPAPLIHEGLRTLEAWRFRFATMGAWHKTTRHGKTSFGTGYVLRSACEPFLIGAIGSPKTTKSTRNIVVGKVRQHSRKPEEAYEAAERLMPRARRADLFSRKSRPGWMAWGREAGKFDKGQQP